MMNPGRVVHRFGQVPLINERGSEEVSKEYSFGFSKQIGWSLVEGYLIGFGLLLLSYFLNKIVDKLSMGGDFWWNLFSQTMSATGFVVMIIYSLFTVVKLGVLGWKTIRNF